MTDLQENAKFYAEAKSYAEACLVNIREMLAKLEHARDCDGETCDGEPCEHFDDSEWHDEDEARQAIEDDALSVEVRSDWHTPGGESEPSEYCILITTGGPAARIVGDLDKHKQPTRARFEYQDWFKPWTEVILHRNDGATLLEYAGHFYYGE